MPMNPNDPYGTPTPGFQPPGQGYLGNGVATPGSGWAGWTGAGSPNPVIPSVGSFGSPTITNGLARDPNFGGYTLRPGQMPLNNGMTPTYGPISGSGNAAQTMGQGIGTNPLGTAQTGSNPVASFGSGSSGHVFGGEPGMGNGFMPADMRQRLQQGWQQQQQFKQNIQDQQAFAAAAHQARLPNNYAMQLQGLAQYDPSGAQYHQSVGQLANFLGKNPQFGNINDALQHVSQIRSGLVSKNLAPPNIVLPT